MTPEEMYEKPTDFREYIDRFCKEYDCTKEDAFKHKVIKEEIVLIYKEDE